MFRARVIPCLLLTSGRLVKTVRFKNPRYVGDPVNAVRIFNDKEVDEIAVLDISATLSGSGPPFEDLADLASECFMPLTYGGGVTRIDQIERLFKLGLEKVALNTAAFRDPGLVQAAVATFGSQSIVGSMDVHCSWFRGTQVWVQSGKVSTGIDPVSYARRLEDLGVGEIFLNSIDRDGVMSGYDIELIQQVSSSVQVPVIACGGAGSPADLGEAVKRGGAAAAAAGSLFVYHGKHRAVLINYPNSGLLEKILT